MRIKQTARKSVPSTVNGRGKRIRARTYLESQIQASSSSRTATAGSESITQTPSRPRRKAKTKSSNKDDPIVVDDDDDDEDSTLQEELRTSKEQGPPVKKRKVEKEMNYIIALLPERYKVFIPPPATTDTDEANTPGFALTLRAPPTKPEAPTSNEKITVVECGMMYDTHDLPSSYGNIGGLPVFMDMCMDSNGKITGNHCFAGGQIIPIRHRVWFYPGFETALKRIRHREEVQQLHDQWKAKATEAYNEDLIVWKVKRICWEVGMVKELALKGKGLQWQEGADPRWIRYRKPVDIVREALLVHFGDVADDRRWPRRNRIRQASRRGVVARGPLGFSMVDEPLPVSDRPEMEMELPVSVPVREEEREMQGSMSMSKEMQVDRGIRMCMQMEAELETEMDLAGDRE